MKAEGAKHRPQASAPGALLPWIPPQSIPPYLLLPVSPATLSSDPPVLQFGERAFPAYQNHPGSRDKWDSLRPVRSLPCLPQPSAAAPSEFLGTESVSAPPP